MLISTLFEGEDGRKLSVCSPSIMLSGIMELIGKWIEDTIVQGAVGIGFLAPCIYKYLSTWNMQSSTQLVSVDDLFDTCIKENNEKVTILIDL